MVAQQQGEVSTPLRHSARPPGKEKPATRPGSLAGQLVRDPDLRYTNEGRAVAIMRLAVSQRVQDPSTGEWGDSPTEFFDVKAWGRLAENLIECLAKGYRVVARGHWTEESWTDKQGNVQVRQVLVAHDAGPSLLWAEARVLPRTERGTTT